MRVAGKILARVAKLIIKEAVPGRTLKSIDALANKLIIENGAKPSFLDYQPYGAKKPYPASICASVNDVVVHGVPNDYLLKSGNVLKLDFGVNYDGYNADAAWTIGIGKISRTAQKLIKATERALMMGINEAKAGKTLGDIGYAISRAVTKDGFKIIEGLTGHGIGKKLHEEPSVFNEGERGRGLELKEGMALAIEPMVSAGSPKINQRRDDSFAIADGSLSAHFEHTIIITARGPEIITII